MNQKGSLPKFCRQNKKSQRQLKHLNSDYFIKVIQPDKKNVTDKKKTIDNTNKQSITNKRLSTGQSNYQNYLRKQRCDSNTKTIKKKINDFIGMERTRSTTVLHKRKSGCLTNSFYLQKGLDKVYSRIQVVLEAYQTKICMLEEKNKELNKQNLKLRALSLSTKR